MTEDSETEEAIAVASTLLFADCPLVLEACALVGADTVVEAAPVPRDEEDALEAALPLRLWTFEKLRELE